ncbi:hypothetical protein M7I_5789 [Glarea lozoyensis 74030]|uniref:Reverse transcriptase domain-containing protein n=1 Tax=Glarea lozoyensis (strain ATCC 74030 / MF5533) TaxID=1104152 RepID=H0ESU2_GLAL7|nr:hypothetical protein M7I_5789 [Glarea lozoyensis 74030]
MSSSVFSETLQEITTTKLSELSRRRTIFEDQKASVVAASQAQPDQKLRLAILSDGLKQCFAVKTAKRKRGDRRGGPGSIIRGSTDDPSLEILLKNFDRFSEQARYDPSISARIMDDWEITLKKRLDVQSLKYQYAALYETIESPVKTSETQTQPRDSSRAEWEELVFADFKTDETKISSYLGNLFGKNGTNDQAIKALEKLRKDVEAFEISMSVPGQINNVNLKWAINGLLSAGLLSEEKNTVLRDFLSSTVILTEVADVLNMRMSSLHTWSWETDVPIEQRRHVTGAFHMYIDEDLLQAIFLQYIGVKWSVFFKNAFISFSKHEDVWTSLRQPVSSTDLKRREYFLGKQSKKPSVQAKRQKLYKSRFFMSQLPSDLYGSGTANAQGEEEVVHVGGRTMQTARAPRRQLASKAARKSAPSANFNRYMSAEVDEDCSDESDDDDTEDEDATSQSPMATKQFLLHLVASEIIVNTKLHGEITVTRSEFESFLPWLPHSTIYAVLNFFGVSEKWLIFFRKFLEAPLKFVSDGPGVSSKIRKRGCPGAHALSSMFSETVLFCLDYSVNQNADGLQLFRMHDDFWMWSPSQEKVVRAWKAVEAFRAVMGVSLNETKTGTVRVLGEDTGVAPSPDAALPAGEIRWGFLLLDPVTGRFVIDQDMVDKHIEDLKSQLDNKKGSVFSWIQAWNTYAGTFFKTNFGRPANCFGRGHVDMMLSTMTRIQTRIFSDSNVVEFLKSTLEERFGIKDIPDGYLYFPTGLGGLELQNPFIGTLQVRDAVFEQPATVIDDFIDGERMAYNAAKKAFDNSEVQRHSIGDPNFVPHDGDTFFSFEEFSRYREEFRSPSADGNLLSVFKDLLKQPSPEFLDATPEEMMLLNKYAANASMSDGYMRWVAQLYGPEMVDRFGGLKIVDAGLLPIGMVNLFRSGRVQWKG